MQYPFYVLLGFLPSLIWLSFYLKKDRHPEPNSMIIKIFLWGMLLAPLAVILELGLTWLLEPSNSYLNLVANQPSGVFFKIVLAATLVPALVEEYLKYAVVKLKILKNSVFDEPIDAMLYCLIAGLGFAAIENLLSVFNVIQEGASSVLNIIIFRFLGATLLHALASALVGYWLAKGILYGQKRKRYLVIGLTIAILFHSCYNFIITLANQAIPGQEIFYFSAIALLLIAVALLVSSYFRQLKKQQAICLNR